MRDCHQKQFSYIANPKYTTVFNDETLKRYNKSEHKDCI